MRLLSNTMNLDVNINIPPCVPSLFTQGFVCGSKTEHVVGSEVSSLVFNYERVRQANTKITQEKGLDGNKHGSRRWRMKRSHFWLVMAAVGPSRSQPVVSPRLPGDCCTSSLSWGNIQLQIRRFACPAGRVCLILRTDLLWSRVCVSTMASYPRLNVMDALSLRMQL